MSFEELLADIDNPTLKRKIDEDGKTRWLGRVKLLATEGQEDQEYTTTVAVWAENRDEFNQVLHTKTASRHLILLHCENAMPAVKWLYDYPGDYAALELAKGVFSNWPIAFGTFEKIEKPIDESTEAESYLTITEHDIPPLPEQKGIPFWDQEWIVPELKELLFAQPNEEETLNTYLIVDATLRKEITGFFDLDTLNLPVKCLFKGEAAEELKEVAPYLIDMTLPEGAYVDKDKVPGFHKDFFENHWDQGTGILIRSTVPMDEIYHHFRKFTKLRIEESGREVFFRFWDSQAALTYFTSIQTLPKKSAQWVNIRGSNQIECFISHSYGSEKAWCVTADTDKLKDISNTGTLILSPLEIDGFKRQKREEWLEELLPHFKEQHPFYSDAIGDDGLRKVMHLGVDNAATYGLTQKLPVALYIHVMLYLGSYFDTDPLLPWAKKILNSEEYSGQEIDKAQALWQGLLDYLKITCGDGGEYLQNFMVAFQQQIDNQSTDLSNEAIISFIKKHYPEKAHYMGDSLLQRFVQDTGHLCKQRHLHAKKSTFYLSYLRLVYGTKITEDPLFPWLKATLETDHTINDKDNNLAKEVYLFYNHVITQIVGGE